MESQILKGSYFTLANILGLSVLWQGAHLLANVVLVISIASAYQPVHYFGQVVPIKMNEAACMH